MTERVGNSLAVDVEIFYSSTLFGGIFNGVGGNGKSW